MKKDLWKEGKLARRLWSWGCFLVPVVIIALNYWRIGIAPFGDKTVLAMDMSGQYVEFFNGLKYGDMLFSWGKALGTNYIGLFAYYLASPLSWLTVLCPNRLMPIALALLTLLKVGLAGASFGFFLRRRYGDDRPMYTCLFATLYALMSYTMVYSMCVMWLDAVIWLPLVLLGLERVLAGKSPVLLGLSTFAIVVSNYYTGYMALLFAALYFVWRLVQEWPKLKATAIVAGKSLLTVILGAGLGGALLVPTAYSLFEGKVGAVIKYGADSMQMDLHTYIKKLFINNYDTITNHVGKDNAPPYIYCGLIVLVLVVLYFFLRGPKLRDKAATLVLGGLLLCSPYFVALDRIWHGFQFPTWFPYRYAFVISGFLIIVAYRSLLYARTNLADFLRKHNLSLARFPFLKTFAAFLLVGLCLLDVGQNAYRMLSRTRPDGSVEWPAVAMAAYTRHYDRMDPLYDLARQDPELVRCVTSSEHVMRTLNEPIAFGTRGITHYSSAYATAVRNFTGNIGMAPGWYWCASFGSTPVTDALFAARYHLANRDLGPAYTHLQSIDHVSIYRTKQTLPIATRGDPARAMAFGKGVGSALRRQEQLFLLLAGSSEPVYRQLVHGSNAQRITITSDGNPMYADFQNPEGEVKVNGQRIMTLNRAEDRGCLYLGTFPAGQQVVINLTASIGLNVFSLDVAKLHAAVTGAQGLADITFSNRVVKGTLPAGQGDLLTTIPYSPGWKATVNGQVVETYQYAEALLAVKLPEGAADIKLSFTPPGLTQGLLCSLAAAMFVFDFFLWQRKRKGGRPATAVCPLPDLRWQHL